MRVTRELFSTWRCKGDERLALNAFDYGALEFPRPFLLLGKQIIAFELRSWYYGRMEMRQLTRRQFARAALATAALGAFAATGLSSCGNASAGYQQAAEKALASANAKGGVIVLMDPASGEVLALATTGDPIDAQKQPNMAFELHAPGSTFKVLTLAAALELGAITADQVFSGPASLRLMGGTVTNAGNLSYQRVTADQALAHSVNTVYAQIALKLSCEQLTDFAEKAGYGKPLAGAEAGASAVFQGQQLTPLQQAWAGIGQPLYTNNDPNQFVGPKVSPLYQAALFASIANGGTLHAPWGATLSAAGLAQKQMPLASNIFSPGTLDYLRQALAEVVEYGTGMEAAVPGVDVRGKTGTGESGRGYNDCWFCGYAEKDGMQLAFSVLLEAEGSTEACRVTAGLLRDVFAKR